MKLRKILMGLAAVVGFTTAATAATPVAVWDGDFDETTKGDYTLTTGTGHEVAEDGSTITIGDSATAGVKVSGGDVYTIVVKASGYTPKSTDKPEVIAAMLNGDNSYMGLGSKSDKKGWYIWNNGAWGDSHVTGKAIINDTNAHKYTVSYTYNATGALTQGTTIYMDGVKLAGETGLRGSALGKATSATIGGHQSGSNLKVAKGLVIEGIAIFDSSVSTAEASAYMFPSETPEYDYNSVLSLNFGASAYNVPASTDPGAFVADSNWYNLNGNNITDAQAGDAFVSYGGSGTYQNTGKLAQYLKGYIDDNNGGTAVQVNISITNLTGAAYDVYIYCSSDNADGWPYKTVNGANYYALANGEATLGTASWGNNAVGSMLGINVMVIRSVVPGENGSITIASARNGSKRGCIAAIQLGECKKVIPKEFSLELSQDAEWQGADWNPSIPEEGMAPDAVATVTATGNPTLTLDGTITVGTLKIASDEGSMLTVKKGAAANTSFGSLDVSAATDGTTWDSKDGFTACNALLNAARTGNYKFYFTGEGESGVTLDYGTAQNNYTFNGHYIFDGGTHTFQNCSESAGLQFGANATVDNPTFWVKDGTTLNFKSRNPCGWSATASDAGIVRIGNGAKVVLGTSASGTWYWSQQFYLEDGATLEIGTTGDNFRTVGNDAEKPHFVVPSGATAEIAGGADNYFALPANAGGAAVFNVGEDATLTVSAKLKTLANGKPLVKYGAGTLALTGDASAFNGAIQVKEGTLEYASATALGAAATIAVDEGATLRVVADEDRAFTKTISGAGYVVKAGYGTLALTPGQFNDNLVSIEDGDLAFTITHEQAASGVVLCKAATDISEDVTVVNAAGEELEGAFTFENNTLTFKASCVDLYLVIDESSPALWSSLIEGKGWIDSPESTITITNETTVTFWFDVPITAKSLKIVSASSDVQLGISYEDFANLTIGSYDFAEAVSEVGGVAIYCEDAPANTETRIITGATIAGFENVVPMDDDVPEGTGFYADATHIWLCKEANTTFANPVTGEKKAIDYAFFGTTDGNWADLSNWRKASGGLWAPDTDTKIPGVPGGTFPDMALDGSLATTTEVSLDTLEGWDLGLAVLNGMDVTVDTLNKFQSNTAGKMFLWVDGTSSIAFDSWGTGNSAGDIAFAVAAEDGITFNMLYTKDNTINYNMTDDASVNYAAGITAGTHNLTNGTLKVEVVGFRGGTLNVLGDAALVTPALTAKVNIAEDTTLALSSTAEGDLVIGGNWANNGTLNVVEGTIVFKPGVTPGNYTEGDGKVIIGQLVTINDCGKIAVSGETEDDVRLFDVGGNPVEVTKVEGGYAYYEWDVTGKNCWWDYEFDGNLKSTGTDTTTMSPEGTTPYYNEDETALRVGYGTPYRGASYPEEFTAVLYGKMVNNANHMEIGFGSTTSGTKYGVVIACGDPSKDEAKLLITSGYGILETIPMTVTDPYDTDHLYAFTCQTVGEGEDAKTKVSVYVDGKFLQAYTFPSKITLGSGFQVGSIHGGSLSGATKATTANDHADLDFLRVYQTVLSAEAMTKYAEKYPYTSKGGASVRTFDGAGDWTVAEGAPWTVTPFEAESFPTNSALAGSVVTINATAEGEITMNLDAATTYESLTVGEGSDLVISLVADTVEPTITGLTTIKANVTVGYDAIKFGNIEVASGKTLTFDFDGFPFADYYQDATIVFTGATSGEGTITATGLPESGTRTATFVKNASTDQYELKIAIAEGTAFIYTIAQGAETGIWTFGEGGEEVTEEIVDANPGTPIQKEGDGTLQKDLANRSYVVNAGLFTTTNAAGKYATITVNENATFDFNGSADGFITMNLAGGTLLNNGGEMGTGSRQMQGLAVTADSTVGGTGDFGLISGGYAANTLNLGGATLTKADANAFFLCDTTVTNGTFDVTEGTIKTTGYDADVTEFAADAALILRAGTTLDVAAPLEIAAITANDATINNAKSVTPFTLTGSATLAGDGTWGTNTIDGATVTIGTKRDFAFNGAGTVNVTLTEEEYNGELPITLFAQGETGASEIGTVMYNDQDITEKCTREGNRITAIKKGGEIDPSQGGEIQCDTPQAATNLAEAITDDPYTYIKAPEGLDETAAAVYQGQFMAVVAPDGTTVTLKLNPEGEAYLQGIVDEATDDPDIAAALCDPTAESITYADGTFMLGFYYWVAGGTDVAQPLATNGEAVQPTAYGDMTLDKPDLGETPTSGFYVIKADFKAPAAE